MKKSCLSETKRKKQMESQLPQKFCLYCGLTGDVSVCATCDALPKAPCDLCFNTALETKLKRIVSNGCVKQAVCESCFSKRQRSFPCNICNKRPRRVAYTYSSKVGEYELVYVFCSPGCRSKSTSRASRTDAAVVTRQVSRKVKQQIKESKEP